MTSGEKLQLSLSAVGLSNVAGFMKGLSDPFAVVTKIEQSSDGEETTTLGMTEVIKNTMSPSWSKMIHVDWVLRLPLLLKVEIFDKVNKTSDIPMGHCYFEISDVLSSNGNAVAKRVRGGKGSIYAHVEKTQGTDDHFILHLSGLKLVNKNTFGKSNPFFAISRSQDGPAGQLLWNPVYRSERIYSNLNPVWEKAKLSMRELCNGDSNRLLRIDVYFYKKNGKHQNIGWVETSVKMLLEKVIFAKAGNASEESLLILTNGVTKAGGVKVLDAEVEVTLLAGQYGLNPDRNVYSQSSSKEEGPSPVSPDSIEPTFVNYLAGVCKLSLCVAIDFTASNGDPRNPKSLHYINPDGDKNEYEKAIDSICSALVKYESDHKIPVWGFGVKINGERNDCFQCGRLTEVTGVIGILDAYRSVFLQSLVMSEPTDWSNVITNAANYARNKQNRSEQDYTVLLILSDGTVEDMDKTIDALDDANSLPLSIIFVGVGGADFRAIKQKLSFCSRRDFTQFVDLDDYSNRMSCLSQVALSRIPQQLEKYFIERNIMPQQMPGVKLDEPESDDSFSIDCLVPVALPKSERSQLEPPKGSNSFMVEVSNGAMKGSVLRIKSPVNGDILEIVAPEDIAEGELLTVPLY